MIRLKPITAEENADGLIEVHTPTPINGKRVNLFTREQLDAMTFNGQMTAEGVQAVADEGSAVAGAPVQPVVEVPTEEAPAVTPIPTEKLGKEVRSAYHLVPIERTMEDLHDGALEQEEIDALVQARIDEAQKAVEAIEKKKPVIGASKEAYLAAKQQWQAYMDDARQRLDYYNELQKREDELKAQTMEQPTVEEIVPQAANEMQEVTEPVGETDNLSSSETELLDRGCLDKSCQNRTQSKWCDYRQSR